MGGLEEEVLRNVGVSRGAFRDFEPANIWFNERGRRRGRASGELGLKEADLFHKA